MIRLVLLLVVVLGSLQAMAGQDSHDNLSKSIPDSVVGKRVTWMEIVPAGKMLQSAHPVTLTVKGNSLCVNSKYQQDLPIYTQGGSLYMAMKLTPGENWLYGLPSGRYRINNRIVNIL